MKFLYLSIYFFLDIQHCTLKFGSWSFDESGLQKKKSLEKEMFFVKIGVNLTSDGDKGQLDAYVKNGEWDLESI